jgi:hypothetical protein
MLRWCVLFSVFTALVACGPARSAPDAGTPLKCHERPLRAMGAPLAIDAQVTANVFSVPLTVGSTRRSAVVDTGAPVTLVDPGVFAGEPLPQGQGALGSMSLGALRLEDVTVVGAPVGLSTGEGPLAALVGGDLLCHFETSFDYRQARVLLGEQALPMDLAEPVTVPAPVKGGGLGQLTVSGQRVLVAVPPTRLVVSGLLDGVARSFVLDSGASLSVLRPSAFRAVTADGRKTLGGLAASTVMGSAGVTVARAKTLALAGAEVQGALVATLESDALFEALSVEVGQPVDGLLGGTFLREFLVTADYAGERVLLRRYPTRQHVRDEFTRVGVVLAPISTATPGQPHYAVQLTFPGSDAEAQGLAAGREVVSVDGQALEPLNVEAANALLLGASGATKGLATPSGVVVVKVEDLLAP